MRATSLQTQSSSYENPSLTFPVSLDSIFANHVGAPELLYSKCWVQYNPKTACVSVQLAFNVSVHAFSDNFSDSFPYDRHIIPFQIETRAWKTADGVREGWTLLKEVPDWAPKKYDEDKTIITEGMTTADLELKSEPPFAELSDKRPLLCLRKERIPNILFRRQGLPVFIIVLLALLIFFIRGRTIEMEYAAVSASFLTFTAYTLTVNDVLGHTNSKLTYVDHYFSLAYIYYVVITLKIMAVSMTCGELAEFDHDEYSKDSRTDLGWHLMPLALMAVVDVLITVVFFKLHHCVHFLVNAVLLVVGFAAAVTGLSYLYLPRRGRREAPRLVPERRLLRHRRARSLLARAPCRDEVARRAVLAEGELRPRAVAGAAGEDQGEAEAAPGRPSTRRPASCGPTTPRSSRS